MQCGTIADFGIGISGSTFRLRGLTKSCNLADIFTIEVSLWKEQAEKPLQ
jgi:hypothetical protein